MSLEGSWRFRFPGQYGCQYYIYDVKNYVNLVKYCRGTRMRMLETGFRLNSTAQFRTKSQS